MRKTINTNSEKLARDMEKLHRQVQRKLGLTGVSWEDLNSEDVRSYLKEAIKVVENADANLLDGLSNERFVEAASLIRKCLKNGMGQQ